MICSKTRLAAAKWLCSETTVKLSSYPDYFYWTEFNLGLIVLSTERSNCIVERYGFSWSDLTFILQWSDHTVEQSDLERSDLGTKWSETFQDTANMPNSHRVLGQILHSDRAHFHNETNSIRLLLSALLRITDDVVKCPRPQMLNCTPNITTRRFLLRYNKAILAPFKTHRLKQLSLRKTWFL